MWACVGAVGACLAFAAPAGAADFEVTSTGDTGDTSPGNGFCVATGGGCTLRAAIEEANLNPNPSPTIPDTISFEFAAAGVQTIVISSALPAVGDPVVIDGYTDSESSVNTLAAATSAFSNDGLGSDAAPTVELDLNNKTGLVITAGKSTVRGLAIYNVQERVFIFNPPADPTIILSYAIELRTNGGNTIAGDFIGLRAAGTAPDYAKLNKQAGIGVISGDNNTIGGTAAAARNVISANGGANGAGGIHFEGTNSKIQGNLIGTTKDGTAIPTVTLDPMVGAQPVYNGQRGGIEVNGFSSPPVAIVNLVIGGTEPNAGNLIAGNLHDSNSGAITINANTVNREVKVLGNRIGTNAAGTAALGNITNGLYALSPAQIGDDAGHGNLVSGGAPYIGLRLDGGGHVVQGNRIGTNAAGTAALANGNGISTRAHDMLIGGTTPAARNVISGNTRDGITGDSYNHDDIQGNFIGTNAAGTAALPNGFAGINVAGGVGNTIGGAAAGSDNVISGNGAAGVLLTHPGEGSSATENVITGNKIGTNAAGTVAVPNTGPGVYAFNGGRNVIGRPSEGNLIANNGGEGVLVSGVDGAFGPTLFENDGNSIRGNSIFSNGRLGIDLNPNVDTPLTPGDGVTANDAGDGDNGSNQLQNFPLVNAALPTASTFIRGYLNSQPNVTLTIDLYRSATCDASGNGEGGKWLGSTTATTNVNGDALWNITVAETVPLGEFVTGTATDPSGNTSEFSACRESGTQVPDPVIAAPQQAPQPQQPTTPTPQPQPAGTPCADKKPPITTLKRASVRLSRDGKKLDLNGTSADHRECPSGVARVDVSLARVKGRTGTNCRFIKTPNRYELTEPKNCRRPTLFKATGTDTWTFTFPVKLKPGLYRVQARGTDKAKNKETPKKDRNIVFFEVR
jgi:CSLREA domain-containing protein